MAFKQLLALACLVASSLAFVTPMTTLRAPATTSARSTASGTKQQPVVISRQAQLARPRGRKGGEGQRRDPRV